MRYVDSLFWGSEGKCILFYDAWGRMLDLGDAKWRCNVELELIPVFLLLRVWGITVVQANCQWGKHVTTSIWFLHNFFCAYCPRFLYMLEPAGRQLHLNNTVSARLISGRELKLWRAILDRVESRLHWRAIEVRCWARYVQRVGRISGKNHAWPKFWLMYQWSKVSSAQWPSSMDQWPNPVVFPFYL